MTTKTIITGPPRSGTTLLLVMFHKAGYDIGYSNDDVINYYQEKSNGFEFVTDTKYRLSKKKIEDAPPFIKETFRISDYKIITGLTWAEEYNWDINNLIICIRPNEEKARNSYLKLIQRKREKSSYQKYKESNQYYLKQFYDITNEGSYLLLRQIARLQLSPVFLEYPKYKLDFNYFHDKLNHIFQKDKSELKVIWDESIDKTR